MSELDDLRAFDIAGSAVSVWTFKKSVPTGQPPVFSGRWIDVDDALASALHHALTDARDTIAEMHPFGLLAQANEGSVLVLGADETHAPTIVAQTNDPTPARKVRQLKEINNSAFYVVKFVVGGKTLHAVRKTDDSWRSRKVFNALNVLYTDEGLTLDTTPRFSLSRHFDFLIHEGTIFVFEKNRFESVLSYKQAHAEDFAALQAEAAFTAVFADVAPLVAFVGSNKIHLRRACAIREKANFRDIDFMTRLRQEYVQMGFTFAFDDQGRFVCTDANCPDIIKALLDHRLDSRLSCRIYDVGNTEVVG
jgi:hypothetical protein